MVEILNGRLGKHSVERVRYVINNLLHLVIVKYGVISLVLCISTCLRLVTILSLLVKYLVKFHADPCNKSYIHSIKDIVKMTPFCISSHALAHKRACTHTHTDKHGCSKVCSIITRKLNMKRALDEIRLVWYMISIIKYTKYCTRLQIQRLPIYKGMTLQLILINQIIGINQYNSVPTTILKICSFPSDQI